VKEVSEEVTEKGVEIGMGIGIGLVILVLVGILVVCYLLKKRRINSCRNRRSRIFRDRTVELLDMSV